MLLSRLLVLIFSIIPFGFTDVISDLENDLLLHHRSLPKSCHIKSPQMKLAFACAPLMPETTNVRFHKVHETNGVNFCFNSFVKIDKGGNQVDITVLRDVEGTVRRFGYRVDKDKIKKDFTGKYILPLEGLTGKCFGYTPKYQSYCSTGFFGFGNTDIQMTLAIDFSSNNGILQETTVNHATIKDSQVNSNAISANQNFDLREVNLLLLESARSALAAYAKKRRSSPISKKEMHYENARTEAFRRCDALMIELESKWHQSLESTEQNADINWFRRQLEGPGANPKANAIPDVNR